MHRHDQGLSHDSGHRGVPFGCDIDLPIVKRTRPCSCGKRPDLKTSSTVEIIIEAVKLSSNGH